MADLGDARARLIRLVHVGRRELRLDEDTYRALLQSTAGKDSASEMTVTELEKVVSAMKLRGFRVRANPSHRKMARDPMSSKIRALWLDLHEAGYVQDRSEKALNAYVLRSTGVADLHWIDGDQATKVIEELKKWRKRDIYKAVRLVNSARAKGLLGPNVFVQDVCKSVTGSTGDDRANLEAAISYLEGLVRG